MIQPTKDRWSLQNEIFWQTDYYSNEMNFKSEVEEEEILQEEDWHEPDNTENGEGLYQEE